MSKEISFGFCALVGRSLPGATQAKAIIPLGDNKFAVRTIDLTGGWRKLRVLEERTLVADGPQGVKDALRAKDRFFLLRTPTLNWACV